VRSTGDPLALTSSIRAAIATVDPDVPLAKIRTMSDLITKKFGVRRLGVVLVGFFSGATLLLSAIGLYGLLAYAVSRRTREIGIRIAVGARSTNILQLVIRRGLKLAGTGLLIGADQERLQFGTFYCDVGDQGWAGQTWQFPSHYLCTELQCACV
jgi:putative ABC transport system permease protein